MWGEIHHIRLKTGRNTLNLIQNWPKYLKVGSKVVDLLHVIYKTGQNISTLIKLDKIPQV